MSLATGSLEKAVAAPRASGILVTAFGPFKEVVENPSAVLAAGSGLNHVVLEVSYAAVDRFLEELAADSFELLLLTGVAMGRDRLTPEFYGRNFNGKTPDVSGEARFGLIDETGPLLLPSTLWKPEIVAEWTLAYPVQASLNAGNYLCNYITYRALEKFPGKKIGFLHVPDPEKLPIEQQAEVLSVIVRSLGEL